MIKPIYKTDTKTLLDRVFLYTLYFLMLISGIFTYDVSGGSYESYKKIRAFFIVLSFATSLIYILCKKISYNKYAIYLILLFLYGIFTSTYWGYFGYISEITRFLFYINAFVIFSSNKTPVKMNWSFMLVFTTGLGILMYTLGYGRGLNLAFRVGGNVGSPMGYAALVYVLYLATILSSYMYKQGTGKHLIYAILALLGIILSGSRSILFIFVLTVVLFYTFKSQNKFKIAFRLLTSIIIVSISVSYLYLYTDTLQRFIILLEGNMLKDSSTAFRIYLISTVIENFGDYFVFGLGLGSFPLWFENLTNIDGVAPHLDIIWLLTEFGILGTLFYIYIKFDLYQSIKIKEGHINVLLLLLIFLQLGPFHFANSLYFYQVGFVQFAMIGVFYRFSKYKL